MYTVRYDRIASQRESSGQPKESDVSDSRSLAPHPHRQVRLFPARLHVLQLTMHYKLLVCGLYICHEIQHVIYKAERCVALIDIPQSITPSFCLTMGRASLRALFASSRQK